MKIEWDEVDLKFIDAIKKGEYDNEINRLTTYTGTNPGDTTFAIKFKVTDPILANMFLFELNDSNRSDELKEKFGINIQSIGFDDVEEIKNSIRDRLMQIAYSI